MPLWGGGDPEVGHLWKKGGEEGGFLSVRACSLFLKQLYAAVILCRLSGITEENIGMSETRNLFHSPISVFSSAF